MSFIFVLFSGFEQTHNSSEKWQEIKRWIRRYWSHFVKLIKNHLLWISKHQQLNTITIFAFCCLFHSFQCIKQKNQNSKFVYLKKEIQKNCQKKREIRFKFWFKFEWFQKRIWIEAIFWHAIESTIIWEEENVRI